MKRIKGLALLCCTLVALAMTSTASAIVPILLSDDELARSPIIVIGHWQKETLSEHSLVKGNVCLTYECHSRLIVTQVIRGDIGVGARPLLYDDCVSWNNQGTFLNSATSALMMGDVSDVSKPCIWFLSRKKSWDARDKTKYFYVKDVRCIQDVDLLSYYLALRTRDPRHLALKTLLKDKNPKVTAAVKAYFQRYREQGLTKKTKPKGDPFQLIRPK